MRRKGTNFTPLPYPSPQGEGTSGNPTASGWGIKNIIKNNSISLVPWCLGGKMLIINLIYEITQSKVKLY